MRIKLEKRLKLYGFNNLTKTLSFNIYDVCYAKSEREQKDYIAYIDEQYNSERLTSILCQVTEMIGATVLNISKQDYDPQGASVTLLISETGLPEKIDESCNCGKYAAAYLGDAIAAHPLYILPAIKDLAAYTSGLCKPGYRLECCCLACTIAAHLDKSHVTVHTYPEYHPDNAIATFRVDIDVSTCGTISPLNTLDFLIDSFDSDIITIDYRVRGFTRDTSGKKLFIDHKITSIQDYIKDETLRRYDTVDINVYQANIFHTQMLIKELELQNYLFKTDVYEIPPKERLAISNSLRREMIEIYSGMNVYE